jgi:predicted  nucleic acid-binding Zn-ribbon protein
MNMNDPFGFGKLQQSIQRAQQVAESVNKVATKLNEDYSNKTLESIAKTTDSAHAKINAVEETVAKAKDGVADTTEQIQAKREELANTQFLTDTPKPD